ncbi:MYND-type domain-containing protein [Aphelenchoides besseyi]|nr:MYND-type domain-containing protein [Aphelenchoides besseyi]
MSDIFLQTDNIIPVTRPTNQPPPPPIHDPMIEIRTFGVERESGMHSEFMFTPDLPMFLDSITEEDSDDLRTQSSASSHQFGSNRAASTDAAEVDNRIHAILLAQESNPSIDSPPRIVELSTPSTDENRDLTIEDTRYTTTKSDSVTTTTSSSPLTVVHVTEAKPLVDLPKMTIDADRDQTELLVHNNDHFATFTSMDDGRDSSVASMSINLDRSRDSLLDHSICSNPHDENSMLHQTTKPQNAPKATGDSDDDEALPAPPTFTNDSRTTSLAAPVSSDSAAGSSPSDAISPNSVPGTNPSRSSATNPERLATISALAHGYNSPLIWTKSKLKSNAFGETTSVDADKENTKTTAEMPRLIDSTVTTYQSSFVPEKSMSRHQPFGMSEDLPPSHAPPPLPSESRGFPDGTDEYMTERTRSNYPIREIPVQIQRSADPFGASYSSSMAGSMPTTSLPYQATTTYKTTNYDPISNAPQQEEYYRREVMTRTLVTRSTEALSGLGGPAPLSRSSPIDHLRQLPDPRDEITEEFRYKYSRHVEEEEKRIRESQEKRRKEEEDRRRRIDELRRGLEQQEAARLESLRIEGEKIERQFENEILLREADEKNRIARNRQLREEEERRRRDEWDRMEEERKRLEEAEIAKRREYEEREKERLRREQLRLEELERQKIEAERRRLEELEKQRLERLRQEQLEIKRLESIALEQARKQAEEHERQRALERREEMLRQEQEDADRLERLRREQERLEFEKLEALRREEKRKEDERREEEILNAAREAQRRRNQERIEDEMKERQRKEEEMRLNRERLLARQKEEDRKIEEQRELNRLAGLDQAAQEREAQRKMEKRREMELMQLERSTKEYQDREKLKQQQRELERQEEERRLAELEAVEKRKAMERARDRELANERERARQEENRKSMDHLQDIAKTLSEKEKWANERLRLLRLHEEELERKKDLTSKETLERLTRKPYYSTEKLSTIGLPEVSTKVERQVFERVDKTLWTSNDRFPDSTLSILPDSHDGPPRERLYAHNASQDDNDFRRSGSNRTSKYKANMEKEKARREYFASDAQPSTTDYRGPLLQQFHSGELGGSRLNYDNPPSYAYGKSPYDQEYEYLLEKAKRNLANYRPRLSQPSLLQTPTTGGLLETDIDLRPSQPEDDVYRSKSVLGYTANRQSRRDVNEPESDAQHSRSKSADYLMDKRLRDETAAPENELQKTADGIYPTPAAPIVTEHEQRYRKSTEHLQSTVPEWSRPAPPTNLSQTTDYRSSGYGSRPYSRQQYESSPPYYPPADRQRRASGSALIDAQQPVDLGSPVGGISFPAGMFDKYKDEIEDMRRSRSSLHQVDLGPAPTATIVDSKYSKEYAREEYSKRDVRTFISDKLLPGYTVSTVPSDWNLPRDRASRVVEVADIGHQQPKTSRYGGRVTIEEVLDAIFQETNPSNIPLDPSDSQTSPPPPHNIDGPGIYTTNGNLMDRVIQEPYLAEELLKKSRAIAEARQYYVSCKHCYTYYCSRRCRTNDWHRHKDRCSFARINTLCKEVIMKVRKDPTTQYHMSKVARDGYRREGRGSVNIRLISAHSAQQYLEYGWTALLQTEDPNQLLFYYPVQTLIDQRKEPSLIQLCQRYNPKDKFILSVSIIADIEQCPETPPPEPSSDPRYSSINKPLRQPPAFNRSFDRYGALVPTDV